MYFKVYSTRLKDQQKFHFITIDQSSDAYRLFLKNKGGINSFEQKINMKCQFRDRFIILKEIRFLQPWSVKFQYRNAPICGLALRPLLLCHNSDDFFKAFIVKFEAFSIIIERSHKILWQEFRIKTNHKVRPGIKGSV